MPELLVVGEGCPEVLSRTDYYRSLCEINGANDIRLQGKIGKLERGLWREYGEYGEKGHSRPVKPRIPSS